MPRNAEAALQAAKQHRWLATLAKKLPLSVPEPLALGEPSAAFAGAWSVVRWLRGSSPDSISTPQDAVALAEFVLALRSANADGAPPPGAHNALRGVPLPARDRQTRLAIAALGRTADTQALLLTWAAALDAAPWQGPPRWIHGDLLPANLLMQDGRLSAVLDFGLLAAADPAVDLMAAWTTLRGTARPTFLAAASPDRDATQRGRGWALSFAAIALPFYGPRGHPLARVAQDTLREILSD
jgi:aminoglycoside phosphotransferase (APT) family kinase protein